MRLRLASTAVLLLSTVAARADSVTFTLLNPTQAATAGSTLTFSATTSASANNAATEYLNGISEIFTPVITGIDDNAFYNTYASFLNPGDSFTGDLFTLMVPTPAMAGSTYTGVITLYGGATDQSSDTLATGNVSIAVSPSAVATTPEPSSLLLLGTAICGIAVVFRRRFTSLPTA